MVFDAPIDSDKIDILSTEDEKLKGIGEILSSDSSRQILKLLFNHSLPANQIAQKTDLSLPLVMHHLKKMQNVGVVKITNIGKNTKSHDVKFYTIDKVAIVILPSEMQQSAKKSKSLFNSFNRIHRLATLGGISIATWFSSQLLQSKIYVSEQAESISAAAPIMKEDAAPMKRILPESFEMSHQSQSLMQTSEPSFVIMWSIIAVLSVVIVGLTIEIIISSKKKKLLH